MSGVSLPQQIAALRLEIQHRRAENEKAVRNGKMRKAEADHLIACLVAALETLTREQFAASLAGYDGGEQS